MKNNLLLFTTACLLSVLFSSCHTSKKAAPKPKPAPPRASTAPKPVSYRSGKQPKFIDGVYMDHHARATATVDAVQPKRIPEKKPKVIAKVQHAEKIQHIESEKVIASTQPKVTYIVKETRAPQEPKPAVEDIDAKEGNKLLRKYAEILGVKARELDNTVLYSFIDKWYGTDYKMGGCDISGIDCSGFAQRLYGDVYGVDLLRTSLEQFKNCQRIKHSKDAEEGDLIFFRISGKRISHVGVYLINDFFVHASTTNGVMISNLNEDYWRKTYAGIGRVPRS